METPLPQQNGMQMRMRIIFRRIHRKQTEQEDDIKTEGAGRDLKRTQRQSKPQAPCVFSVARPKHVHPGSVVQKRLLGLRLSHCLIRILSQQRFDLLDVMYLQSNISYHKGWELPILRDLSKCNYPRVVEDVVAGISGRRIRKTGPAPRRSRHPKQDPSIPFRDYRYLARCHTGTLARMQKPVGLQPLRANCSARARAPYGESLSCLSFCGPELCMPGEKRFFAWRKQGFPDDC